MTIVQEAGFRGANTLVHRRFLPDGVGVNSVNQKPTDSGNLEPWREPLTISGPNIPAGRLTLYRMGRDTASKTLHWLSWTTVVHAMRGFDASDPTERTYYTGSGSPKWTNNVIALAAAPYPNATRELAMPAPTVAPIVTLSVDGSTGDARQLYYCFTWVNDIGWESAPSPPFLAPLAKPGATLNLTPNNSPPAGNYGINRLRWYRQEVVGDTDVAEYFFIREYAVGAAGQMDDARALGEKLATEGWLVLDSSASWLTDCWAQFAAALVGKAVRFCEPGIIYAWPIEYEYPLTNTPIALAAFAQRLVAFTTAGAEVFTGVDPAAMDQKPLALPPIVSQRSLAVADSFCMYAAADGLWLYSASGERRNLTGECLTPAQWAALVPSTIAGYLFEIDKRSLYIGFYNAGAGLKGFVIDPANPLGIYWLDKGYTSAWWDPLQRALFVLDGSTLKQWDAGAAFMTATWTGKVHRQKSTAEAEWLELLCDGPATVKVYTEQAGATSEATPLVERMSRTVTRGEHRLPDGTVGRDFQVQISTGSSVQGLVVE